MKFHFPPAARRLRRRRRPKDKCHKAKSDQSTFVATHRNLLVRVAPTVAATERADNGH